MKPTNPASAPRSAYDKCWSRGREKPNPMAAKKGTKPDMKLRNWSSRGDVSKVQLVQQNTNARKMLEASATAHFTTTKLGTKSGGSPVCVSPVDRLSNDKRNLFCCVLYLREPRRNRQEECQVSLTETADDRLVLDFFDTVRALHSVNL